MDQNIRKLKGLQENVTLAPFTTFKIGGPTDYFVVANSASELVDAVKAAKADGIKWFILGGGSDVLVADAGFRGLAIKSELSGVSFDDESQRVRAESGVKLGFLITQCLQHELTGLEYATGVPASVGGAVWANLGARGTEIKDILVEATILDHDGNLKTLSASECAFGYRDSIFKHEQFVILDALFQLKKSSKEEIQQLVKDLAKVRKDTQDVGAKCAGCVFRNPKDQTEVPAAKLIDDLDLKGKTIGGAQVSTRHANFVINTGDATADDVIQLISYIKQQVRDKKGVQLMEEIEYIGFE